MSSARRLAKCSSACLRCAGHTSPPVQRAMASLRQAHDRRAALGTLRRHHERRAHPCGRARGATRTTSGITSPARRTITVSPIVHVLAADLVLVVQRRVGDGRAADEHRRQPRDRRDRAGAADLHVDARAPRRHLLRRKLVRDRPARLARDESRARAAARGRRPCRRRRRSRRADRRAAPARPRRTRRVPSAPLHDAAVAVDRKTEPRRARRAARLAWPAARSLPSRRAP